MQVFKYNINRHNSYAKAIESICIEKIYLLNQLKNVIKVKRVGSTARNTFSYKGRIDVDIFMYYFEKDFQIPQLKEELKVIFKEGQITQKNKGFPYFIIKLPKKIEGLKDLYFELIPYLIVNPELKARTELHHDYVLKNLTTEGQQEVRKAKYFLKKIGLYGADSNIKGFSGYCVECLVIEYGSIFKVPEDLFFFKCPTEPTRNLFASISPENLQRFKILKSKYFKHNLKKISLLDLYYLEDAPLKLHYNVKNHPNVTCAVYRNRTLIVELKDHYLKNPKTLESTHDYWKVKNHQELYLSVLNGMKKIQKKAFFNTYKSYCFKPLNNTNCRKERSLIKTFLYFR